MKLTIALTLSVSLSPLTAASLTPASNLKTRELQSLALRPRGGALSLLTGNPTNIQCSGFKRFHCERRCQCTPDGTIICKEKNYAGEISYIHQASAMMRGKDTKKRTGQRKPPITTICRPLCGCTVDGVFRLGGRPDVGENPPKEPAVLREQGGNPWEGFGDETRERRPTTLDVVQKSGNDGALSSQQPGTTVAPLTAPISPFHGVSQRPFGSSDRSSSSGISSGASSPSGSFHDTKPHTSLHRRGNKSSNQKSSSPTGTSTPVTPRRPFERVPFALSRSRLTCTGPHKSLCDLKCFCGPTAQVICSRHGMAEIEIHNLRAQQTGRNLKDVLEETTQETTRKCAADCWCSAGGYFGLGTSPTDPATGSQRLSNELGRGSQRLGSVSMGSQRASSENPRTSYDTARGSEDSRGGFSERPRR